MDELLNLLRQNARASIETLAAELDTTPKDVAKRIAELEAAGVLLGYQAIVDT
jgi:DNA-binding Lrp family transcriptional regulator